jgi:hypothetical protein
MLGGWDAEKYQDSMSKLYHDQPPAADLPRPQPLQSCLSPDLRAHPQRDPHGHPRPRDAPALVERIGVTAGRRTGTVKAAYDWLAGEGYVLGRGAAGTVVPPIGAAATQAPLGMPLSLPRRLELLDWAVRRKRWIVEDDYYGEFNLTARPMSALSSLDEAGRVLYAGTFSKTLLPSLRLGYLIVPPQQVERFRRTARALLPAPPVLVQHTVCEFMQQGHFGRHMRRMRRLYAERKHSLIAALQAQFGAALRLDRSGTGLHLIAHLRAGADDAAFARAAHAAGLGAHALSAGPCVCAGHRRCC